MSVFDMEWFFIAREMVIDRWFSMQWECLCMCAVEKYVFIMIETKICNAVDPPQYNLDSDSHKLNGTASFNCDKWNGAIHAHPTDNHMEEFASHAIQLGVANSTGKGSFNSNLFSASWDSLDSWEYYFQLKIN